MTQAYYFVLRDGTRLTERPTDGQSYTLEIVDRERYEQDVRSGEFYLGLGGDITDNRKTT